MPVLCCARPRLVLHLWYALAVAKFCRPCLLVFLSYMA